ncbi:hypothetical protein MIMGU_mgv11b0187651mg, partial [Erythranthe guttata]
YFDPRQIKVGGNLWNDYLRDIRNDELLKLVNIYTHTCTITHALDRSKVRTADRKEIWE